VIHRSASTASEMPGQGDNVVRLGCAEQAAIAEELRRHWQHIVEEGVPEHLREFVLRFAEAIDRRGAGDGVGASQGAPRLNHRSDETPTRR
jgi:hypothetical protein